MAEKSIVFTCANPVPEIYPDVAIAAGAYIVATGRGDFPNQINNSCGFPGILKGALISQASKITDRMAIRAAHALANYAENRGIHPGNIIPTMDEAGVFPFEAAEVACQAVEDGVARCAISHEEAFETAKNDIQIARATTQNLIQAGFIPSLPKHCWKRLSPKLSQKSKTDNCRWQDYSSKTFMIVPTPGFSTMW